MSKGRKNPDQVQIDKLKTAIETLTKRLGNPNYSEATIAGWEKLRQRHYVALKILEK